MIAPCSEINEISAGSGIHACPVECTIINYHTQDSCSTSIIDDTAPDVINSSIDEFNVNEITCSSPVQHTIVAVKGKVIHDTVIKFNIIDNLTCGISAQTNCTAAGVSQDTIFEFNCAYCKGIALLINNTPVPDQSPVVIIAGDIDIFKNQGIRRCHTGTYIKHVIAAACDPVSY